MFDIIVNDQLVAIAVEGVVKLFVNALVTALPVETTIKTQKHPEPPTEALSTN